MDYKNYFRQRMLIKDQRFFDVFKMAVAYTPMMNISEFIVKNVCQEEEDLNLEEMQEEIQDYRQMKEQLETVQQKKAQLSLIHEQYTGYMRGTGACCELACGAKGSCISRYAGGT